MKAYSNKQIVLEMDVHEANIIKECLRKFSQKNRDDPYSEFANKIQGEFPRWYFLFTYKF